MSELIQVARMPDEGVMVITFNRPELMNCLSSALIVDLNQAVQQAADDETIRALVLTGAGDKAFCTGMDLKERATLSKGEIALQRRGLISLIAYLHRLPKPTVAAVNGVAMGGGFEIALACDLIVAAENARFALPEVRVGIMPAGGGTQTLTWLIGPARARDLILTGRAISTAEAYEWGIVARKVASGEALTHAVGLAAEIGKGAPIGLRQAKAAIRRANRLLAAGLDEEDELYQAVLDSEDRIEGLAAFKEKRPPHYKGR